MAGRESSLGFGAFLSSVNVDRGKQNAVSADADAESLGKAVLQELVRGDRTVSALGEMLRMNPAQIEAIIQYLRETGMIRASGDGPSGIVGLTDFAAEAMKVFSVR